MGLWKHQMILEEEEAYLAQLEEEEASLAQLEEEARTIFEPFWVDDEPFLKEGSIYLDEAEAEGSAPISYEDVEKTLDKNFSHLETIEDLNDVGREDRESSDSHGKKYKEIDKTDITKVKSPPASFLLKIANLLPENNSKNLRQEISDMRLEYYEALFQKRFWRARCILAFYYIGLVWSLVMLVSDKAKEVVGIIPEKD